MEQRPGAVFWQRLFGKQRGGLFAEQYRGAVICQKRFEASVHGSYPFLHAAPDRPGFSGRMASSFLQSPSFAGSSSLGAPLCYPAAIGRKDPARARDSPQAAMTIAAFPRISVETALWAGAFFSGAKEGRGFV